MESDSDEDDSHLRPYEWSTLSARDTGVGVRAAAPGAAQPNLPFATGHSVHCGPPFLRCSVNHGHYLAHLCHREVLQLDVRAAIASGTVRISVEPLPQSGPPWSACSIPEAYLQTSFTLSLRFRGETLAHITGRPSAALSLPLDFASLEAVSPGDVVVASLVWPSGSRHLHVLVPPTAALRFSGLVATPSAERIPSGDHLLSPSANISPPPTHVDRGFGLECELVTAILQGKSKAREWRELIRQVSEACAGGKSASRVQRLLERSAMWRATTDNHIMTCSECVAELMVDAALAQEQAASPSANLDSSARDWVVATASGGGSNHKTEFVSPGPPHELSFARDAASEIACVLRLIRHQGATAPSVSRVWHGGASLHCHVNVTNPEASGELLNAMDILSVFFRWVEFDLVIGRLARPWMWREPSSAPLYATGSEFAWVEDGFEQGSRPFPASQHNYDVPLFIEGCRRVIHQESGGAAAFGGLSLEEQLARLFYCEPKGTAPGSTPGALLGRHGSMNLRRITSYGTLEIRRFHGTVDEHSVVHWASFCVGFVEHARSCANARRQCDALLSADDATAADALHDLQRAQEVASVNSLIETLDGTLDRGIIEWLREDACPTG